MRSLRIICGAVALPLVLSGCLSHRSSPVKAQERARVDDDGMTAREEIRKTVQLPKDARVEIRAINGSVDVTTGDGNSAEIVIVRLAKNKETFENRKYELELDGNTLYVVGAAGRRKSGVWDMLTGGDDVRTKLTVRMPREAGLAVYNVQGPVNIGDLNGKLEARGVNGKMHVAKMASEVEISNINGKFDGEVTNVAREGIRIHGVNGSVDLAFRGTVDAEIDVSGVNGRISSSLPNLSNIDQKRGRYRAKSGAGGPRIEITSLNGQLNFGPAAGAVTVGSVATPTPKSGS